MALGVSAAPLHTSQELEVVARYSQPQKPADHASARQTAYPRHLAVRHLAATGALSRI